MDELRRLVLLSASLVAGVFACAALGVAEALSPSPHPPDGSTGPPPPEDDEAWAELTLVPPLEECEGGAMPALARP